MPIWSDPSRFTRLASDTTRVPERDLVWDALVTASERMTRKYGVDAKATGIEFRLRARSRLIFRRRRVVDGFELRGYARSKPRTDHLVPGGLRVVFQPVRERRLLRREWHEVQPVQEAAAAIGKELSAWIAPRS
jgi:hypothetical protein